MSHEGIDWLVTHGYGAYLDMFLIDAMADEVTDRDERRFYRILDRVRDQNFKAYLVIERLCSLTKYGYKGSISRV